VNRKQCIKEELAYHTAAIAEHRARVAELGAELAAINEKQKGMQCMLDATVARTLYIEDLCFVTNTIKLAHYALE